MLAEETLAANIHKFALQDPMPSSWCEVFCLTFWCLKVVKMKKSWTWTLPGEAHLFLCPFLLQEQYSLSRVYPVEISPKLTATKPGSVRGCASMKLGSQRPEAPSIEIFSPSSSSLRQKETQRCAVE